MFEFNLRYRIENKYENVVRKAHYQLLVLPCNNDDQKLLYSNIRCSENLNPFSSKNIFGFSSLHYSIGKNFKEFWFHFDAKVQKKELNPFNFISISKNDEHRTIQSTNFFIEHFMFLRHTDLTRPRKTDFEKFPILTADDEVFTYLQKLNSYIFNYLEYKPGTTSTETPLDEIVEGKKGVCQDYAHLFIAICRKNKIPARYVSGYLDQGNNYIGATQLHAWVEAFLPGVGWIGFDPTNNLLVDHYYIKIAHGTDYKDCSPIIGILETTGEQKSIHSVSVINQ